MDATRIFYLGNRLWWAVGLFIAPIVAAITGEVALGILTAILLILPAFLVFGTERPWWPEEVAHLPEDQVRSKVELRKLNVWSAAALIAGVLLAVFGPWG